MGGDKQAATLMGLPAELRYKIWGYVLRDDNRHHFINHKRKFPCGGSHRAFHKFPDEWNYPWKDHPALWHLLFARRRCPGILLVNRTIYHEARVLMSHEQIFEICDGCCFDVFKAVAKADFLPKCTIIEMT
jgi:hypothetical protein